MGYDSNFNLTFRKADGGKISLEEAKMINDAIVSMNDEPDEVSPSLKKDSEYPSSSVVIYFCESHWYDVKQDLDKFMSEHPELVLEYLRKGEDRDDVDDITWKGGESYDTGARTYSIPLPDGKTMTVGWIDRSCGAFRCVAVPESKLQEALATIREEHPDATVLRMLDLYGSAEPLSERPEDMVILRLLTMGIDAFIAEGKTAVREGDTVTVPLDIYGFEHTLSFRVEKRGSETIPMDLAVDGSPVRCDAEICRMLIEFLNN